MRLTTEKFNDLLYLARWVNTQTRWYNTNSPFNWRGLYCFYAGNAWARGVNG